jgi:hypothetical protein
MRRKIVTTRSDDMIVNNMFEIWPLDQPKAHQTPEQLAAKVAELERENPELAATIRRVLTIAAEPDDA